MAEELNNLKSDVEKKSEALKDLNQIFQEMKTIERRYEAMLEDKSDEIKHLNR